MLLCLGVSSMFFFHSLICHCVTFIATKSSTSYMELERGGARRDIQDVIQDVIPMVLSMESHLSKKNLLCIRKRVSLGKLVISKMHSEMANIEASTIKIV